ncbi:hypothetical protein KCP78_06935 [Salmonella enterica subsp. enterica]|nr:hypothetical protein KCP78_06935 [Salmonella enterica subsp. enterica]
MKSEPKQRKHFPVAECWADGGGYTSRRTVAYAAGAQHLVIAGVVHDGEL